MRGFASVRTAIVVGVFASGLALTGCGGDGADAEGTWVHEEEGTIEIESGGSASLTQSSDPVPLDWELDGDVISFTFDGEDEVIAEATLDGDEMTFRAGDFSGDDPVTFTRG